MTFEELLESMALPSTAKKQLPMILSESIKLQLMQRQNAEDVIRKAIAEINSGSVVGIEELINSFM